jgi:hypothetical protein
VSKLYILDCFAYKAVQVFTYEKLVALSSVTAMKRFVHTLRSTEVWKLSAIADLAIRELVEVNWVHYGQDWIGFSNWFTILLNKKYAK